MKEEPRSGLLTKNKLGEIQPPDRGEQHYLEVVKAFARLTYESVYLIDYTNLSFEYVSDNPLFLCGYTAEEVLQLGYEFYFRHVPEKDLELLNLINEAGFDFYAGVPVDERKLYSITYDFHLIHKDGKHILINHKLTPLFLTQDGRLWKSMCIVSLSHHQSPGNVRIYKQGSAEMWELVAGKKIWRKSEKPTLSERETEVLRLHAQGLSINQIAEKIFVAPDTVKYYRRRIFERLEVNNIVEALSYAVNSKLL
ncbi:helix-turn-helix domain-containing protein [Chitinophaga filiformis]|uniref:Helix-turn-helix transcriptional regulator n=1 Tax=Chitinophaga filiformis TaxID=104663 RepID=A0ABY4I8K7_CHIFI|nr:helix-turn-helix transcriptional regulator [Chitinophaga filiformis]UPK72441.1 helix-turn-helix transcriptional regulator [Chitinophaga filiformis]